MNNNIDTLCTSGGGIKGISSLGIINHLVTKQINLKHINNYVGVSIGAVIVLLLSIGITPSIIYKITIMCNLMNSFKKKSSFLYSLFKLSKYRGLYNSYELIYLLRQIMINKIGSDKITFDELYKLTKK